MRGAERSPRRRVRSPSVTPPPLNAPKFGCVEGRGGILADVDHLSKCRATFSVYQKSMVRAAQASPEQRARFWGHIPRGRWGWTPTD